VSCAQMSNMFLTLGFVQPASSDQEQLLLANIWKLVGGNPDGNGEVLMWNIKVVMCCIMNFHIDWLIDLEREDVKTTYKNIGRFDNGHIFFTPNEISILTKKFVVMYKNR
jgi:hypothetical protein